VTYPDLGSARWRKASKSGGEGGECVELAWPGAVRDSKNPDGPVLRVSVGALVAGIKRLSA
jgi:hypothetical protein